MQIGGALKRYAQATFELARDSNRLEEWARDLAAMAELATDANGRRLFANPEISGAQKLAVAERYLSGRVSPQALNLTRLLISRDRFAQVDQLAAAYADLVREYQGVAIAEVTTAVPLDEASGAEVSRRLGAIVGRRIELRPHVDPSIIGGLVARVGDYVIDGSVTGQLQRLRTRLIEGR